MRFIPTFILEHWMHKTEMFALYTIGGKLYGYNLPKIGKEIKIHLFHLANGTWIEISKEKP